MEEIESENDDLVMLFGGSDDEDDDDVEACTPPAASTPPGVYTPPAASTPPAVSTPPGVYTPLAATPKLRPPTPEDANDCDSEACTPPAATPKLRPPTPEEVDDSTDLERILSVFGEELKRGVAAKRRRVEKHTSELARATQSRLSRLWRRQRDERARLNAQLTSQLAGVVGQWEGDRARVNHAHVRMAKIVSRQMENSRTSGDIFAERMKNIEASYATYAEKRERQVAINEREMEEMRRNLEEELGRLQKKMVTDIQKKDIDNVRNTFKTVAFL